MKSIPLIFALLLAMPFFLSAQDDKIPKNSNDVIEIGVSDINIIDQLMVVVPGIGSNAREFLRHQNIKAFMMPMRKVGFRGNDICYAAAICLEYYVNLDKNYKVNLSPDFLFLSQESADKAISVTSTLHFLTEAGTVSAAILPYDAASITHAVYATQKYKINNYLFIFRSQTNDRQKIYETKKALMRGNPVLVEINANKTIKDLKGSDQISFRTKPSKNISPFVVVAYDDDLEAFQLMSTWGKQWGLNGHAWINYKDFGKEAVNGYVLVPMEY